MTTASSHAATGAEVLTAGALVVVGVWLVRHVAISGVFPDAIDSRTSRRLRGPILTRYKTEGGPDGHLGLPISNEELVAVPGTGEPSVTDRQVRFEHGAIQLEARRRSTTIRYYSQTPKELPA